MPPTPQTDDETAHAVQITAAVWAMISLTIWWGGGRLSEPSIIPPRSWNTPRACSHYSSTSTMIANEINPRGCRQNNERVIDWSELGGWGVCEQCTGATI